MKCQRASTHKICETDVVAVRILDEGERVVRDLVHKLHALVLGRMINAPLQHAAAVAMSSDLDTVCRDGVVDELDITSSANVKRRANDGKAPGCPRERAC